MRYRFRRMYPLLSSSSQVTDQSLQPSDLSDSSIYCEIICEKRGTTCDLRIHLTRTIPTGPTLMTGSRLADSFGQKDSWYQCEPTGLSYTVDEAWRGEHVALMSFGWESVSETSHRSFRLDEGIGNWFHSILWTDDNDRRSPAHDKSQLPALFRQSARILRIPQKFNRLVQHNVQ